MTSEALTLTAVFETVEDGWIQARISEIPGIITAAPTQEEARELLFDAVREYLLSLLSDPAGPVSEPATQESLRVTLSAAA